MKYLVRIILFVFTFTVTITPLHAQYGGDKGRLVILSPPSTILNISWLSKQNQVGTYHARTNSWLFWDENTGQELFSARGKFLSLSADQSKFIVFDIDRLETSFKPTQTLIVRSSETGNTLQTLESNGPVTQVDWLSNDQYVISYNGRIRKMTLWDVATGRIALEIQLTLSVPIRVAWDPDQMLFVAFTSETFQVWNLEASSSLFGNMIFDYQVDKQPLVDFSMSNEMLYLFYDDGSMSVWEFQNNIDGFNYYDTLKFSDDEHAQSWLIDPDHDLLVSWTLTNIVLWNIRPDQKRFGENVTINVDNSWRPLAEDIELGFVANPYTDFRDVPFLNPNGKFLALYNETSALASVAVYSVDFKTPKTTGNLLYKIPVEKTNYGDSFAWSPSGDTFTLDFQRGNTYEFDSANGNLVRRYSVNNHGLGSFVWSPLEGFRAGTRSGVVSPPSEQYKFFIKLVIWSTQTDSPIILMLVNNSRELIWSEDDSRVLIWSDKKVYIWKL